jgi:hypothetical protein
MSAFLNYFIVFMVGFNAGIVFLLWWQTAHSKQDEPTRPMTKFDQVTQSPETLADFIEDINGSPSLCDFCIYKTYKECGSIEKASCHEGIAEYLKQEL